MVKKKSGREINPADAYRKAQRAKEIERNKKGRQFQREALRKRDNPEVLKQELAGLIAEEQQGGATAELRLKRKAVATAFDAAVKKQREQELRARGLIPEPQAAPGVLPSGVEMLALAAPRRAAESASGQAVMSAGPQPNILPPPDEPPPAILPPPVLPGNGATTGHVFAAQPGRLPPPTMPPPVHAVASPQATASIPLPPPTEDPPRRPGHAQATIAGEATAVARPLAHNDAAVTSMVPAALRVRRERAGEEKKAHARAATKRAADFGFGLAPMLPPAAGGLGSGTSADGEKTAPKKDVDSKYAEFLSAMGELGAFDS